MFIISSADWHSLFVGIASLGCAHGDACEQDAAFLRSEIAKNRTLRLRVELAERERMYEMEDNT